MREECFEEWDILKILRYKKTRKLWKDDMKHIAEHMYTHYREQNKSYLIHEKKIKTCSGLNGGPSTQKYLCPNAQLSYLEKGFWQM